MSKHLGRTLLRGCKLENTFREILIQSPCSLRDDIVDEFLRGIDNPIIRGGLNKAIGDCRRMENGNMCSCLLRKIMNYSIKKWIICISLACMMRKNQRRSLI